MEVRERKKSKENNRKNNIMNGPVGRKKTYCWLWRETANKCKNNTAGVISKKK